MIAGEEDRFDKFALTGYVAGLPGVSDCLNNTVYIILSSPFIAVILIFPSANGIQVSDDVYKYSDTSLASLSYRINGTSIPITLNSEWKSYTVFLPKDLKERPQLSLEAKAVQGEAKVDITNPVWKGDFAEGKIKITAMNGDDSMIYTVLFKQSDTPGKPATYPIAKRG